MKGVASLEVENSVVFFYLSESEICLDNIKRMSFGSFGNENMAL
jgi:hypothetical protein